jgi:hypothetical protein
VVTSPATPEIGSPEQGPPRPSWPEGASLTAILQDVRDRLGADTSTVLLVDRTRTVLQPTATVGLDRTTRGAPPVPIGEGFAGRVAQTRQPVIIGEVGPDNVINPVLINHGVRSLLGVPILVGSELLGVLHVGRLEHHDFTDDEVLRLTEVATSLGEVLRRRFIDEAHTAALALQRSLLPTAVRAPEGLQVAARYVPAEGDLGGDWYDVFELPGDRLALVMGDVVGHGLDAAVVMGRLRSVLRAYALEHDDPAEVLTRLDQKICHFETDVFATVLLGIAEAPYDEWLFSSAGHLAPVVTTGGEPAREADVPVDRLLGLTAGSPRRTTPVTVPPGGLLCMFTDGLVERRPAAGEPDVDIVGENVDLLRTVLADVRDAESACIQVLSRLVGDHLAEDDIALLVARRLP